MRNKVTNSFFNKLILKLNLKKIEANTENTRSSIGAKELTAKNLMTKVRAVYEIILYTC